MYMLVLYTIVGSSLMAVALLLHYVMHGTTASMHSLDDLGYLVLEDWYA